MCFCGDPPISLPNFEAVVDTILERLLNFKQARDERTKKKMARAGNINMYRLKASFLVFVKGHWVVTVNVDMRNIFLH